MRHMCKRCDVCVPLFMEYDPEYDDIFNNPLKDCVRKDTQLLMKKLEEL